MAYTSVIYGEGNASKRFKLSKANRNYTTQYFQSVHASGDIRIQYLHDRFTSTGGGEVIRAVAEGYGTGVAAGATLNAAHFTGRVGSGTVSGALNASGRRWKSLVLLLLRVGLWRLYSSIPTSLLDGPRVRLTPSSESLTPALASFISFSACLLLVPA